MTTRIALFVILASIVPGARIFAQGCVAIRGTGSMCTKHDPAEMTKGWQLNTSYRYFKSFRHFVGTEEQHERLANQTQVINWQHTLNFNIVRHFNGRWSVAADVPVLSNTRSSLYEHGGNNAGASARHKTHSSGLGDIRITAYRWLIDPLRSTKANVQAGLGVKLPTGNYRYQDFFVKGDAVQVLGPVDQSIQLGDGGTGLTAELNLFYQFNHAVGLYSNLYYLVNPREENGVSTSRGSTPSQTAIDYKTATMSVPDQYMARAGANFSIDKLTVSGGLRLEGIPSSDLVGGDEGFRRPGYVVSAEPGASYQFRKFVAFATVPVALERNRTQSYADKLRTAATGTFFQGDAAFADYAINIGCSIKF